MLIIDPTTNSIDTTAMSGLTTPAFAKWAEGVLADNGKIYGIPYYAATVLIIDPVTDSYSASAAPLPAPGGADGAKWIGGVLAGNGKIYGIPAYSTSVLIFDPMTNTADTTTITGLPGDFKWLGGVLVGNGKIVGIPGSASTLLIINTTTNTTDTATAVGPSGSKWLGGVLAGSNGNKRLFGIPHGARSVLIVEPFCSRVTGV